MGKFESGKWIVGLLIYFFVFFLIMTSVAGMLSYYDIPNQHLTHNDPGFMAKNNFYSSAKCEGSGEAMNFLGTIQCSSLKLDIHDVDGCTGISGCTWMNSSIFGEVGCIGNVNKTAYNITGWTSGYCESPYLQTQELCILYRCPWINESLVASSSVDFSGKQIVTIWSTVKYIVTFQADIGLGVWNFIFIFIFFYIPFIMFLFAIYMALPFLH